MHRKSWSTTMSLDTEPVSRESQAIPNTILLVEDDPNIGLLLVEAIAQETPYRAIVASDSNAALKLVRYFTPDLFILDYGLPGMNGIELYDRLQSNKEFASVPVVLITANRQVPQQQIRQRQLITFMKPLDLDSFLATIETLLTAA
jgi:DNA-binding response OmpR family regulator